MVTPQGELLLFHIARYRVTTIDAVYTLFFAGKGRDAARMALHRLCEDGYLARFEIRNRSFYRLTPRGCSVTGLTKSAGKPLAMQSLIERYAMLAFCCLQGEKRERITGEEFARTFPALDAEPGIDPTLQHYYLEKQEGVTLLGRATVDNAADVGFLCQKCDDIISRLLQTGLQEYIEEGLFRFCVLTAQEIKKERLVALLEKRELSLQPEIIVVKELSHIL